MSTYAAKADVCSRGEIETTTARYDAAHHAYIIGPGVDRVRSCTGSGGIAQWFFVRPLIAPTISVPTKRMMPTKASQSSPLNTKPMTARIAHSTSRMTTTVHKFLMRFTVRASAGFRHPLLSRCISNCCAQITSASFVSSTSTGAGHDEERGEG